MPRVFSSVKEVWQGVLSGAIVPTHHHAPSSRSQSRRVSCSNIQDRPPRGCAGLDGGSSSEDLSGHTALSGCSSGSSTPACIGPSSQNQTQHTQCITTSSSSDTDGNDSTNFMDLDEDFECSVFVRLEDNEDNDKSYDISALSDADLRRLKHEDPFLYYSIPSIRRRSYRLDGPGGEDRHEQDVAGGEAPGRNNRMRRPSLPAAILANAEISRSSRQLQVELNDQGEEEQDDGMIEQQVPVDDPQGRRNSIVRRNRRLSTEAHPTLICDSLLRELQGLDGGNSFMDDDDLALLGQELDDDTF